MKLFDLIKEYDNIAAKRLIISGYDLDSKDDDGQTPLHRAITRDNNYIAELLIISGCDLNIPDKNGCTPLHSAIYNGNSNICKLLVDSGCKMDVSDNCGDTILHYAILFSNLYICKSCFDYGLNFEKKNLHYDTPVDLLGHMLEISKDNSTLKEIEYLIDHLDENYPHEKDSSGNTRLHAAGYYKNDVFQARYLIQEGLDINIQNDHGDTPLHVALWNRSPDVAKLLILYGADLDIKNKNGNSPHMMVTKYPSPLREFLTNHYNSEK